MNQKTSNADLIFYNAPTVLTIIFIALFALITHSQGFDIPIDTLMFMSLPSALSISIQIIKKLQNDTRFKLSTAAAVITFGIVIWITKDIPTGPVLVPAP